MEIFQVFLVILGLAIIGISYIISEKIALIKDTAKLRGQDNVIAMLADDGVKEQINQVIHEELSSALSKTEDILSQISNEKIMAISEYSDQVLEKINQNHTEVVFLYNMLNEKEEIIKNFLKKKEDAKKKIEPVKEHTTNNIRSKQIVETVSLSETTDANDQITKNKQILHLYSEGKSILEISKLLEIGQGEIKFVIDLSRGLKT